jgi:hypothetical protein
MTEQGVGRFLMLLKLYTVEIASTAVFLVWVLVETVKAIKHLLR